MTETSVDTIPIHDFRARNGWHATMTRHGRGRQPQYETRIHDAQGRDAQGRDAQGRDAQGRDAQGRDAQGRDAQGRDVPGIWIYTNLKDAKLTVEKRIQQLTVEKRIQQLTVEKRIQQLCGE